MNDANGFALDLHLERRRTARCGGSPTRLFNADEPGLGSARATISTTSSDREFAPQISTRRVQLRDQPHDRHLRAGAAQGRQASVPARERRGDDRRRGRQEATSKPARSRRTARSRREGRATRRPTKPAPSSRRSWSSTSTASRSASRACRCRRQLRRPVARTRATCLHVRPAPATTAATATASRSLRIFAFKDRKETTLADDMSRLRAVGRRLEGAGRPASGELDALRRDAAGRKDARRRSSTAGPDGRPRARRGVGADLRRGLAPLPRLLLRREHARLRLGGAAQAVRAAARRTSRTART